MSAEPAKASNEIRFALDILAPLSAGAPVEVASDDGDTLRFRLPRRLGWRLRTVVFSKRSLRNLAIDPAMDVKIDYLRRDMERVASHRAQYAYPHTIRERVQQTAKARMALVR